MRPNPYKECEPEKQNRSGRLVAACKKRPGPRSRAFFVGSPAPNHEILQKTLRWCKAILTEAGHSDIVNKKERWKEIDIGKMVDFCKAVSSPRPARNNTSVSCFKVFEEQGEGTHPQRGGRLSACYAVFCIQAQKAGKNMARSVWALPWNAKANAASPWQRYARCGG